MKSMSAAAGKCVRRVSCALNARESGLLVQICVARNLRAPVVKGEEGLH